MDPLIFTLTVIGSQVRLNDGIEPDIFRSHRQAWRYIRRWNAVKVAGNPRQIGGVYLASEEEESNHV